VDYSIKAYKLGSMEFSTSVRDNAYEVDILHRETTEMTRELLLMDLPLESDLRFALSSERICNTLYVMHNQAVEIAANSTCHVENGGILGCGDLVTMGDVVNRLMRLCVVALFEERIEHAEAVLRSDGVDRLFETTFYDWYKTIDHMARTQAGYELAIAKHPRQMARHTHEIADAIVFWLEESDCASLQDCEQQHIFQHEEPKAAHHQDITISGGMQSFLQTVDNCFADTFFWRM
jgi:phosphate uptake regulator